MKRMKMYEGKQVSPLATNPATAGPLDHARRAAGGMLR